MGNEYYALNSENIVKVIPVVSLRQIPGTPHFFSGIFDFKGVLVPVVDLTQLTIGKPADILLSTRIILTHFILKDGRKTILGLMTEDMTEILAIEESDLHDTQISPQLAPYLGPMIQIKDRFIQTIQLDRLFSQEIEDMLFLNIRNNV